MGQEYILYLTVFLFAVLGLQVMLGLGRQATVKVKAVNERMRRIEADNASQASLLQQMRKERGLGIGDGVVGSLTGKLNVMVIQSGLKLGQKGIYILMLAGSSIGFLAMYFFKGTLQPMLLGVAIGLALPVLFVKFVAGRRRKKLVSQLPDALDIVVRSLQAGHPIPVAISLVAKEMPDPIGSEFGMISDEIAFGSQLVTAVQRMVDRVGHPDLDLFAAMVRLQQRTGGNLTELLNSNSATIRGRQKMRLKIKALTAEGRTSALILNCAPIGVYLLVKIMAPDFYGDVEGHPTMEKSFKFAVIWMLIGNAVMRKMINFKI